MYSYDVLMENDTIIEVYADSAEAAERFAEEETGMMAIWAEDRS